MKSRITIIVFLCFLLSVMTGCREQVYKEGNNAANSEIIESKNNLEMKEWAVTHSKLDTTLNKAVFCGNSLFGSTEEEGGIRITEYELTGMNKKLDLFVDTIDSVSSISVKKNGNIVVLGRRSEEFALLDISKDGTFNEINDIQIEKIGLWPEIKGIFFSDDGYCFIWYRMTVPCTEVFENGEPDVYTPVDRIYVKNTDMKTITSVEDYCIQCEIYGEKINFIGYPTDTGFGSAMNLIGEVSINSKSENKDAAWEFVKYYVINGTTTGFPVYVPRYEEMLGNSLETNYSYDADTSEKIAKASYSEPNGVRLYVYSADAEDVDAVRKLVEKQEKNMNMKRTFN